MSKNISGVHIEQTGTLQLANMASHYIIPGTLHECEDINVRAGLN